MGAKPKRPRSIRASAPVAPAAAATATNTELPLLSVDNLTVDFPGAARSALSDLSFAIEPGRVLGIVGESGSGKSLAALSLLGLLPSAATMTRGKIMFGDRDLHTLSERELQDVRGNELAMIFQEPMSALNPVMTIGAQVAEPLRVHRGQDKAQARATSLALLRKIGLSDPELRLDQYPHQLSGGMRQRVMIAMALACKPRLLIADEPTTALDVTIQAQIMDLLRQLNRELQMAIVLITHDLGVVAEFCDDVLVLYAGEAVEYASSQQLFVSPRHPYTKGLLESSKRPPPSATREPLSEIPGIVPSLATPVHGCRFKERCVRAQNDCREHAIALTPTNDGAFRCLHPLP
jgi:peptide/nickel transport system ATP-binding protein